MAPSVQIVYASRYGSTAEVAEAIGAALREAGIDALVERAQDAKAVDGSKAVVLGAALYMGRFPGEIHRFLDRNHAALVSIRPWIFVLGPVEQKDEQFASARTQAEKELAKFSWLKPAELKIFGGRFDARLIGFPLSLLRLLPASPLKKMPPMDIRDWDAIHAWADNIARQLQPAA